MAAGGTLTVTFNGCHINADNSGYIDLKYSTAAGHAVLNRRLNLSSNAADAIRDELNNIIANQTPGAYVTARDALVTQIDSLITSADAGGKLDLT